MMRSPSRTRSAAVHPEPLALDDVAMEGGVGTAPGPRQKALLFEPLEIRTDGDLGNPEFDGERTHRERSPLGQEIEDDFFALDEFGIHESPPRIVRCLSQYFV
jgi:hypothetical protein